VVGSFIAGDKRLDGDIYQQPQGKFGVLLECPLLAKINACPQLFLDVNRALP
jgi:hypothetical protein